MICLTGTGDRAFSAGGDQKQRAETGDYGPSESGLFEIERLHRLIRDVPKPVIAAVNGVAIGGGHVLHVLCDVSIAAETASFGQVGPARRVVRRGLRHGIPRARRRGEARARDLVSVPALRRRDRGAVGTGQPGRAPRGAPRRGTGVGRRHARAVPDRAAVPQAVVQRRHRAHRRHRRAVVQRPRPVLETEEAKEGVRAFAENRAPDFGEHRTEAAERPASRRRRRRAPSRAVPGSARRARRGAVSSAASSPRGAAESRRPRAAP